MVSSRDCLSGTKIKLILYTFGTLRDITNSALQETADQRQRRKMNQPNRQLAAVKLTAQQQHSN